MSRPNASPRSATRFPLLFPLLAAAASWSACAGDETVPDAAPTQANNKAEEQGTPLPALTGLPAAAATPPATHSAATAEAQDAANGQDGLPDEGLDEENWLPKEGDARSAFDAAVGVARVDPAAAVGRFVEAAGKARGFYAAWFNAGASAEAAGQLATAERHYRTALSVRPDYGPAIANLATLLARTGRLADAQRVVDTALSRGPEKAGPHLGAATLASFKKDLAAVEREALLALKYDERNVPAMRLMATVFRAGGRLDTARFALENALALEPGNGLLQLELGHVYMDQQDEKAALLSYERAARLRPDLFDAQENYGLLLLKQAALAPDAVRAFEAAARLEPKNGRAQLHLGNGYRAVRSYDRAEQAYKKALELEPGLADAHFNLAVLYIDNPVPGVEELPRWQKAVVELRAFKETGKPEGVALARVDEYIEVTDKRIVKELKRREREERRKKEDAAAPPKGGSPAPQ